MKQVMNSSKKTSDKLERIAVLRLELDYELAVLFEAMEENDDEKKEATIKKLRDIRSQLVILEGL